MHQAPRGDSHSMGGSDLAETFTYVARELGQRRIAFICAREYIAEGRLGPKLKAAFGGVYIVNERFSKTQAEATILAGEADGVAFGKAFLANPDLVRRLAEDTPLNEWDTATFYTPGAKGYTDYPVLA
jgi:2,4-dienoyl-CoA reductase-like NADH-dependent reductase (Old Yellow Enzyme family)